MPHSSTTTHLTDAEIVAAVQSCGSKSAAARHLNISRNALAWRYDNMDKGTANTVQRWVVTSAQNNAELHEGFYTSLLHLCEDLGCYLRVIPFFYQNPSMTTRVKKSSMTYDHRLIKHWCEATEEIHPSVTILGDLKVQGTAINPVSGLESMTGGKTLIVGHSQIQMQSIARPMDAPPVWIHSTGAVTRPSFSEDAKLAKRASWDHSYGALLIETHGAFWWIWQISGTDSGSFIHHDREYTPKGIEPAPPALALVCGDEHVIALDRGVEEATYGKGGIIETLHPRTLVVHDIYDGLSISPYDDKDPLQRYLRDRRGETDAVAELHLTGQHMARGAGMVEEYWVCGSNHNDWLSRWIKGSPPGSNALLWHELNAALRRTMDEDDSEVPDAFQVWMRQHYPLPNARYLRRDEAALIADIDCALHGDKGADGARGSVKAISKTAYKAITAHLHRFAIEKGVYAVAVSTDSRHYQSGLTTWDQGHVVINGNGKRSLMPIRDGRWRAK